MNGEFGVRMFVAGEFAAFEMMCRNTVSGETRTMTVHARDAAGAYSHVFRTLDAESGDRSWCVDHYSRREA
jgi:hypothetical protein